MTTNRSTQVLVVDDEPAARSGIRHLLSAEGFGTTVASSGHAALDLLVTSSPDVIVTDLEMPEMGGLELLAELRARAIETPVIVATGSDDAKSAIAATRAGAVDYLTKPLDARALVIAIERALVTRALAAESRALRSQNEQLVAEAERNLRAREELLRVIGHDLRGPLSTLKLAISMLVASAASRAANEPFLLIADRAAEQMSNLVADLLDSARIEGGTLLLEIDEHSASSLVREAHEVIAPIASKSGITVDVVVPEEFTLRCSRGRIVQALVNLASNSVNVSAPGCRITMIAEAHGDLGYFAVEDEGPGIAPEDLAHVFERGWRTGRGRQQGAGLGLSIAKGIVDAHHGTLQAKSTLGAGSRFSFELPLLPGVASASWRIVTP